jgi:hypothetical protein
MKKSQILLEDGVKSNDFTKEIKTFKTLDELKTNEHLISDLQKDENGNDIRFVDGKKIIQIEEKTEADKELNRAINLWRMRSK